MPRDTIVRDMMATPAPGRSAERYRFDRFELQPAARRLIAEGADARVGARAFDVLLTLVERPGRVVAKDELLATVWPGVVVEEANLAVQISALRKVLGPGLIATVAGRGYQFTGALEPLAGMAESGAASSAAAAAAARGGVPRAAAPIIGREADLAALAGLLGTHRLVTVTGAGGIGKTRLAMAWCEGPGLGEPIVWMELSGLADAALLPASVLARLQAAGAAAAPSEAAAARTAGVTGVTGTTNAPAPALALLCQAAAPLRLTLVLDNAEPVAAEVAALAQALLDAAPRLRLLVTSQVPLRLQAEQVFRLGTLPVPQARATPAQALAHAAVALFVERARAADPQFELAPGNVTSVVEICRRLDGLPLALELAAARVATIGVNALAAALGAALDAATGPAGTPGATGTVAHPGPTADDTAARATPAARLGVLGEGPRDAPPRQRTLRAALEWSHALLDAPARCVFRRLGVFAGGFSLAAAQAVVGDEGDEGEDGSAGSRAGKGGRPDDASTPTLDGWAVMSTLGRLVEHSLVAKDGAEPPRFSLLESARLFALEQLERAREAPARRARHLAWCLAFVRQVVAPPAGSTPAARHAAGAPRLDDRAAARITGEYANLHAALEHALGPGSTQREAGAELAVALLPYWQHIDAADEQRRWMPMAPDASPPSTSPPGTSPVDTPVPPAAAPNAGATDDTARWLLERLRTDGVLGGGRADGLDAAAVLALARRVGQDDVQTFERAVETLERAVAIAAAVLGGNEAGEPAASGALALDAYVDDALAESSRQARAGDLDRGAEQLDAALAGIDQRDNAHRERIQRARRALLEAALQLDLARRDATAAARRIEALAALQRPERPSAAPLYREREAALLAEGLGRNVALSLEVAVHLLRRRLRAAQQAGEDSADGADGAHERRSAGLLLARALNRSSVRGNQRATSEEAQRVSRDALAATPRAAHPQDWAALQHELATALGRIGTRAGDPAMLDEALACCRQALLERTPERETPGWIESMALLANLERNAGALAADPAHLQAAVQIGRECLRGLSRAQGGRRWASVQSTVASALGLLARREGSTARRHEAVAAYRAALGELSPDHTPTEWGATQCNLGIELAALGEAEPGPAGTEWLQAAVDAYRAALRALSLEAAPAAWAIAQHNLGGALRLLGEREAGTQSLREAALAFGEALKHHTRERAPGHWAAAQNDRALALLALGQREQQREVVAQAVAALRDALLERRRDTVPLEWAGTQASLADGLAALAEMDDDAATMHAALRAAEEALEELTPERAPVDLAQATARAASARAWLAAHRPGLEPQGGAGS
ncbi:MAG: helix-turn-helix transcriptional regulator [Betaproteobacteria bacterium]|nr:helix-turn-helix transcriptional regulator [Betaproteobacteria bacterium]